MLDLVCVFRVVFFFFFKQKTAYEMRISDWSSDVCSSDLGGQRSLFQQNWVPVAATGQDESTPILIAGIGDPVGDPVDTAKWFTDLDELEREIGRASCRERVCQYV